MSVGGGQGCLAVNVHSTPNSDRKFKGLASVATGHFQTHAVQQNTRRTRSLGAIAAIGWPRHQVHRSTMRRRDFITGLASAAAWPFAAGAQQPEKVRRIGVLMPAAANDTEYHTRVSAFLQGLQELGWTIGRNVRIDTRWAGVNAAEIRRHAAELAALAPDVILATGSSTVPPLLQATRTVPIVFATGGDPVGGGYVDSLARPGGNATGFMTTEYSTGGKWLQLLKQIAPNVTRAAVLRDSTQGGGTSEFAAVQAVAPSLRVEVTPVNVRDAGEIERAVAAFALSPNGGLIVTGSPAAIPHRDLIITLAARHKLPAVYYERFYVATGGLISYGPDTVDQFRRAAGYVDRILKGENPADLPVQAPTKYETVINLKTAKALGLTVPETLLATADEVIQ
jgi:putative tryptophan/tyrosine transport system substrate-binding protein